MVCLSSQGRGYVWYTSLHTAQEWSPALQGPDLASESRGLQGKSGDPTLRGSREGVQFWGAAPVGHLFEAWWPKHTDTASLKTPLSLSPFSDNAMGAINNLRCQRRQKERNHQPFVVLDDNDLVQIFLNSEYSSLRLVASHPPRGPGLRSPGLSNNITFLLSRGRINDPRPGMGCARFGFPKDSSYFLNTPHRNLISSLPKASVAQGTASSKASIKG